MKIALSRSAPSFWMLYFAIHFSFLMVVLYVFRWIWCQITHQTYSLDLAEMAFESLCYAVLITIGRYLRYFIGKRKYEKNPVDRRKNNTFRE